ncbi:MFS transporter [Cupriavidus basilensis]
MLGVVMLALFAPFWVWVARRFSKRAAWMAGSAIAATGYLGFWLNTNPDMQVVLGPTRLLGVGTASFAINYWAMLPDTVEFNEWKFGERNEAKIAGFAAFSHKVALAVNAMLLGQISAMGRLRGEQAVRRPGAGQHQGSNVPDPADWRTVLGSAALEVSDHAGIPSPHGG